MKKKTVGILGATGMVGQKFVELLSNHPWFEIAALAASDRSVGKSYREALKGSSQISISAEIGDMPVVACRPDLPCDIVFSGLDSSVAGDIEAAFAAAGYWVISNCSHHRLYPDVPLLIPEINSDHLKLIPQQKRNKGGIITNPNCSVIGLAMALKPLQDIWSIEAVHAVTMQAVSGAGYPGVPSMDILDNVIPFIQGEEAKVEREPQKILGHLHGNAIIPHPMRISAQCNRVCVADGHLACASVQLKAKAQAKDIIDAWRNFKGIPQQLQLPSAPHSPLLYHEDERHPQPKLHRNLGGGMSVSIGRLRPCPLFDWKFTLLSHNTIRGAAGCAVLNAELMLAQGYIT